MKTKHKLIAVELTGFIIVLLWTVLCQNAVAATPPSILGFLPRAGVAGDMVEIIGSDFEPTAAGNQVTIAGSKVKVLSVSPTRLRVKVPKDATTGYFRIQTPSRGVCTSQTMFTIKQRLSIKKFSPNKGKEGSFIDIKGFGFMNAQLVAYVGTAKAVVRPTSDIEAQIIVPPNATTGKIMIMAPGAGHATAKKSFQVITPFTIKEMTPSIGYPGSKVQILGTGFDPNPARNKVTLSGKLLEVLEASPVRLLVLIPYGVSTGQIKIRIPKRGEVKSSTMFSVGGAASINSFSPVSGVIGSTVTITGQGLDNPKIIAFIGKVRATLTSTSPSTAKIIVPKGTISAPIVLSTPGVGRSRSDNRFMVAVPLSLKSFTPQSGPVGTNVTLNGVGFDPSPGKTRVTMGNLKLKIQPDSTSTKLIVTIPLGVKDGPFKVNVFGKGDALTKKSFFVTAGSIKVASKPKEVALPTSETTSTDPSHLNSTEGLDSLLGLDAQNTNVKIDSIDPRKVATGDIITITGSGFGDDVSAVKAWIGNTPCRVDGAMEEFVTIEVPSGVTGGQIKIKISGKPMVTSKQAISVAE